MNRAAASDNYYRASLGEGPERRKLAGQITADVCVIGGGFTGLSAALHLANAGARVVLLEGETIGFGASGRNGGQIHTGLRQSQQHLERWLGEAHARDLWTLAEESKALMRELVARYAIDCALKDGLVIAAHDRAAARELVEETEYLRSHYGYAAARMMDADETARVLGTNVYPAARFDSGGGHLQPLAFARAIAEATERAAATIHEFTRALSLELERDHLRVVCESGAVECDRAILACDAFSAALAPELAPYIAHVESFMTATEPLSDDLYNAVLPCDAAVADTRHVLDYYRKSADRRMLFAGRETYWSMPRDIARIVRPRMEHVYPALKQVRSEYAWSGTVGITVTRMPHLGRLGERVLFAHGYSGQGVALANLGGKLMAEAVLGQPERFEVFARVPAKRFPGGTRFRKPLVTAALTWYKVLDYL
ncbi:MAG: FAD-binding oxidoreductase [Alphaproteobacteria bacterium]|nr:FAD-binding oxidoreductase [Alphaproteobacteria bacterium]